MIPNPEDSQPHDDCEPTSGTIPELAAASKGNLDDEFGLPELDSVGFEEVKYSPAKDRESVRGKIALRLVMLLAIVVITSLAMVWRHPDRSKELHELLVVVLGPLIALVGSATGFYFGSKENDHSK